MDYPYNIPVGFYFSVKIDGISGAGECSFQDVSGLNVSFSTESINEGGNNTFSWKLPTRPKYDNLVLKRGILKNSTLITNWINNAVSNYVFAPKQVDISLLDEQSKVVISWSLVNAYPVSVKISEFKAMENSLAFETLELAYSYFTRTN